jgi:protease-4
MIEQQNSTWEREALSKLLFDTLKEQRHRRRWGIFFKSIFLLFLLAFLWIIWPEDNFPTPSKNKKHVALIDVNGVIDDSMPANADNVIEGLQNAFKDKDTQAVILRINSPGGSPVQADNIYNEVQYLRHEYPSIKIHAVCSDLCTSAAYYIASSTNDIYANPSSLVGSIGVLMDGFGFVDTLKKVGAERRLMTSGDHKGFLDPFSPLKPDEVQDAQVLLNDVHQQFINKVEQGRGNRLVKNNPQLFSGLVWSGGQALPLGLIDGFGDAQSVARDLIKNEDIQDYTVKPNYLDQLADRLGASFSHTIAAQLGLGQSVIR